MNIKLLTIIALCPLFLFACAEDEEVVVDQDGPKSGACGLNLCAATDDDGEGYDADKLPSEFVNGKADAVDRVESTLAEVSADGVVDGPDVEKVFEAMGGKISANEIRVLGDALERDDLTYEFTTSGVETAYKLAVTANIGDVQVEYLDLKYTFAQTELPEDVYQALGRARLAGAVAYDVNELDKDNEGIWSPYPSTTPAEGNMAFDYTMVTPEVLKADMEAVDLKYSRITGTRKAKTADGQEYTEATYEEAVGGTGNILSHYDEAWHTEIYARGRSGQKWANNVAILSDGTFHFLPAARRSPYQDIILTNPQLSRGAHMLYNGHINVQDGVVVSVEMSGRLSKMAAKGKATFINPITLLKAWGFEISPNVRMRYGNTRSGTPLEDTKRGVIQQDRGL